MVVQNVNDTLNNDSQTESSHSMTPKPPKLKKIISSDHLNQINEYSPKTSRTLDIDQIKSIFDRLSLQLESLSQTSTREEFNIQKNTARDLLGELEKKVIYNKRDSPPRSQRSSIKNLLKVFEPNLQNTNSF